MTFRDILAGTSVFLNRDALSPHFLPDKIFHREKEMERMMRTISPIFQCKRPKNIFIYGKTGTGKTSSTKYIMREFCEFKASQQVIAEINYINCRLYNTRYKILQKIATDSVGFSKSGFAPSVFYEKILEWVEGGGELGRFFITVLDEIDMVKDLNELLYTFSRANDDLKRGGISIIGISNKLSFKKQLDPRAKSSLLENEIVFPPYNSEQLRTILTHRAELGFKDSACDVSAINLASAIAARETGDARYALKLLLYSGEIADEKGEKNVTHQHVELARKMVEEDIVIEAVSTLPEHQQVALYALAILTMRGSKYQRLIGEQEKLFLYGEVYEMYGDVCNLLKRERRSARWCKEYLKELESLGLIQMLESGKGMRGHSTLIKLAYSPERIKKAIEELLSPA